jgi:hypothetical protein
MPEQHYSKGLIRIDGMTCDLCPTQWDCILPDGRQGFIHYRWGVLSLCDDVSLGIIERTTSFNSLVVTLEQVTNWLESLFYETKLLN